MSLSLNDKKRYFKQAIDQAKKERYSKIVRVTDPDYDKHDHTIIRLELEGERETELNGIKETREYTLDVEIKEDTGKITIHKHIIPKT